SMARTYDERSNLKLFRTLVSPSAYSKVTEVGADWAPVALATYNDSFSFFSISLSYEYRESGYPRTGAVTGLTKSSSLPLSFLNFLRTHDVTTPPLLLKVTRYRSLSMTVCVSLP